MKTNLKIGAQSPCLAANNTTDWPDPSDSSDPVQPSPTKSNHPLPSGKEIGKQMVKFLAIFDHPQSTALIPD
jgi:hypothetical protein